MAINASPRSIDEDEYVTNQPKKASALNRIQLETAMNPVLELQKSGTINRLR